MAATGDAKDDVFRSWLSKKLIETNPDIDLDVFVSYIEGVLEDDTSRDEKVESLNGLLPSVVIEDDESWIAEFCDEILKKWDETTTHEEEEELLPDEKLASILEKQKLTLVKKQEVSAEQKARKEAILAQYAMVCDGDDEDINDEKNGAFEVASYGSGASMMDKNANADRVDQQQREMREKMKAESEKKKELDKLDREKQKQAKVDRKEKEKQRTQKGERKR